MDKDRPSATENASLFYLFQQRFSRHLSRPAVIGPEGTVDITFADLEEGSALYAGVLAKYGVQKGDRVVVQVEKSARALLLYLACLRRGVIFVPLNTAYTASEVDYFLENAAPTLLVCRPEDSRDLLPCAQRHAVRHTLTMDANGHGSFADAATGCAPEPHVEVLGDDEVAAILYTSGTTGRSKGAMLTQRNLSSNVAVLHRVWRWQDDDVLLHALPIYHAHGLFVGCHLSLFNASPMIFLPKLDIDMLLAHLPRATVLMGVPTYYTRLLSTSDFTRELVQHMRLFISGSAPLHRDTFRDFEQRTGQRILERYGMTEAVMITSNGYEAEQRIAGTVGPALPGVEARVVDQEGQIIASDKVGALEIRGPNVFKGYWQMPEKTQEEFTQDAYFKTGDLATMAEDGRVTIVGRSKDLVISGGFNVYPKEVESLIDDVPGVIESAVVGVPHADFGEAVIAMVVCKENRDPLAMTEEVMKVLNDKLARFKQPKKIFCVEALPRNTMGKVQKNILREEYKTCFSREA